MEKENVTKKKKTKVKAAMHFHSFSHFVMLIFHILVSFPFVFPASQRSFRSHIFSFFFFFFLVCYWMMLPGF